jgi:hypothetical protein
MKLSDIINESWIKITTQASKPNFKFEDEILDQNNINALVNYIRSNEAGNYKVAVAIVNITTQFGNQLLQNGIFSPEALTERKQDAISSLKQAMEDDTIHIEEKQQIQETIAYLEGQDTVTSYEESSCSNTEAMTYAQDSDTRPSISGKILYANNENEITILDEANLTERQSKILNNKDLIEKKFEFDTQVAIFQTSYQTYNILFQVVHNNSKSEEEKDKLLAKIGITKQEATKSTLNDLLTLKNNALDKIKELGEFDNPEGFIAIMFSEVEPEFPSYLHKIFSRSENLDEFLINTPGNEDMLFTPDLE